MYYLYALVNDHNSPNVVSSVSSIDIDFNKFGSITNASLSNLSFPYLVRNGDTVRMSWSTQYKVEASAYTNVAIYGVDVTSQIQSIDNMSWSVDYTIHESDNLNDIGQNITYLG